ncbi:hypothetical protein Tco_0105870 [Tanacetum coccineum]
MFSIIYEPVHGIIYKNSKKEKRVMRHSEIHKFCDDTLNRVLEGLKSYNNDVKYGYVQKDLTKDETEYLKLFEEEIEERLNYVVVHNVLRALVDTESEPKEAPSEAEELQSLGSRVPLRGEEFKAFEPSGTRTDSSHSSASSDSTAPLSPDHTLTRISPTPTPTRVLYHRRTARMTISVRGIDPLTRHHHHHRLQPFQYRRGLDDESQSLDNESQGLEDEGPDMEEEEEAAPEGQQQAVSVVDTAAREPLVLDMGWLGLTLVIWIDPKDGRVYTDILTYVPPAAPVQTPPSPEWSLGYLSVSPSSPVVPSLIASPVATPTATISVDEDQFLEVGAQLELHGSILHNHTQRLDALPLRILIEQERAILTFEALWRQVLVLEAWAGYVDAWMADISRARYDDHKLIHDMLVQQAAMQHELQEMRGRVTTLE